MKRWIFGLAALALFSSSAGKAKADGTYLESDYYAGLIDTRVGEIGAPIPAPTALILLAIGIAGVAGYGWPLRKRSA